MLGLERDVKTIEVCYPKRITIKDTITPFDAVLAGVLSDFIDKEEKWRSLGRALERNPCGF